MERTAATEHRLGLGFPVIFLEESRRKRERAEARRRARWGRLLWFLSSRSKRQAGGGSDDVAVVLLSGGKEEEKKKEKKRKFADNPLGLLIIVKFLDTATLRIYLELLNDSKNYVKIYISF